MADDLQRVKDDGGPAFPFVAETHTDDGLGHTIGVRTIRYVGGMTLRDYFAAHASDVDIARIRDGHPVFVTRAQARYMHADAMIAAR